MADHKKELRVGSTSSRERENPNRYANLPRADLRCSVYLLRVEVRRFNGYLERDKLESIVKGLLYNMGPHLIRLGACLKKL